MAKQKIPTFKEALSKILTKEEMEVVKTAHDILGNIAIIEIPESLLEKEKVIAETLLNSNPKITTVLKKAAEHSGVFRTQKMTWLAGEKTKICEYKENNVRLKFDVEKTYFSSRLSTERKRIYEQIKPNENVLVMFSGAAPYICVISKNTKAKTVTGIEINPDAHNYAEENVKLNKIKNSFLLNADVHKVKVSDLEKINAPVVYDRIAMPLPKTADEFLSDAFRFAKKGTIIHFYDFLHVNDFNDCKKKILKAAKKNKLKVKILKFTKCGQYSPKKYRVCVDFEIKGKLGFFGKLFS
jgi:tRNA (guanine37-N1)-methyltransferase